MSGGRWRGFRRCGRTRARGPGRLLEPGLLSGEDVGESSGLHGLAAETVPLDRVGDRIGFGSAKLCGLPVPSFGLGGGGELVGDVRHLRGTAEPRAAFPALREAFVGWAPIHPVAPGWTLGDLLAWAAQTKNADDLLELAQDTRYGMARQMIVDSLWRFKKHTQVEPVLIRLMSDPDVALHAMSALRRVVGNAAALPLIESVRDTAPDVDVRRIASEQARKALKGTG